MTRYPTRRISDCVSRGLSRGRSRRSAFVLPTVILAMLVVAITAAVMLQRATAVTNTVTRQINSYTVQHSVRGLQEAVEAWLSQQRARTLPDVIDPDGLALSLSPGDGTTIDIYFFDGQGTARSNSLTVAIDIAPDVDAIAEEVRSLYGEANARRFLREVGPQAVSINTAEPQLLLAMASVLAPEERVSDLQDAFSRLVELRSNETLGQEAITQAMNRARISGAERTRVIRLLTGQPILWEAIIVVRDNNVAGLDTERARYRALVLVEPTESASSGFEQPSSFLSWDEIQRGDPRFTNPRYWEVGR